MSILDTKVSGWVYQYNLYGVIKMVYYMFIFFKLKNKIEDCLFQFLCQPMHVCFKF